MPDLAKGCMLAENVIVLKPSWTTVTLCLPSNEVAKCQEIRVHSSMAWTVHRQGNMTPTSVGSLSPTGEALLCQQYWE